MVDRAMLFLCLGSFSGKAKFILKLCLTYFNLFTLIRFFKSDLNLTYIDMD